MHYACSHVDWPYQSILGLLKHCLETAAAGRSWAEKRRKGRGRGGFKFVLHIHSPSVLLARRLTSSYAQLRRASPKAADYFAGYENGERIPLTSAVFGRVFVVVRRGGTNPPPLVYTVRPTGQQLTENAQASWFDMPWGQRLRHHTNHHVNIQDLSHWFHFTSLKFSRLLWNSANDKRMKITEKRRKNMFLNRRTDKYSLGQWTGRGDILASSRNTWLFHKWI
jgi:hypothetical protein